MNIYNLYNIFARQSNLENEQFRGKKDINTREGKPSGDRTLIYLD